MRGTLTAVILSLIPATLAAEPFKGLYAFNEPYVRTLGRQAAEPASPPQVSPDRADRMTAALLAGGIPSLGEALPSLSADTLPEDLAGLAAAVSPPPAARSEDLDACMLAIGAAEARYGIPANLLLAIGLQEAGTRREGQVTIWPWSVNSGGKGYIFESREDAVRFVKSEEARGAASIDTGCLQINRRWHPDAFGSIEASFDPARNADYAARFLSELQAESGDWMVAAGNYHSKDPERHSRYLSGVQTNLEMAATLGGRIASAGLEASSDEFDRLAASLTGEGAPAMEQFERHGFGWGTIEADGVTGNMSIYSARPIEPVLSNLASFPG
ncbi:lytic transglycosylase domain-containing protein [Paracoccus sp. ME4]|uniref:lytic transglycosylase domain-containing protein n=1 Tax=Paracoccus sp. ME4 TaxID=3138066 RepID=UPI00398A6F15